MKKLREFKLSTRIVLSYLILISIILLLGTFSIFQLDRVNYIATELEVNWLPATRSLGDIGRMITEWRMAEWQLVTRAAPSSAKPIFRELLAAIQKELDFYKTTISNDDDRKLFQTFYESWTSYLQEHQSMQSIAAVNLTDAQKRMQELSQSLYEQVHQNLKQLTDFNVHSGVETSRRGDWLFAMTSMQILVLSLLALLTAVGICITMTYYLLVHVHVTRRYKLVTDR